MSVDEYSGADSSSSPSLETIADSEDISDKIKKLLADNGILKFSDCIENEELLSNIKGIGPKTLEKIKELALKVETNE